jgi:hypothetical protein
MENKIPLKANKIKVANKPKWRNSRNRGDSK